MDKKTFEASTRQQTDLMTDPFGLSVLATLDYSNYKTAEDIAEETGENIYLVKEYLNKLLEAEMIEQESDQEESKYSKKADYYTFSAELLNEIPESIQDHWIFGLLHALQGDYYDLLRLAQKYDKMNKALKNAGYPSTEKSLSLNMNRIYVKPEDIDELNEKIRDIFEEYSYPKEEQEEEEDYLAFDLNFMMKPCIPEFNKRLDKNDN